MCTGLEVAAIVGAGASAATALTAKGPSVPDPAKERMKAEAEAAQRAGARTAMQRRAMRQNSLFTGGGDGAAAPAAGRTTLGV